MALDAVVIGYSLPDFCSVSFLASELISDLKIRIERPTLRAASGKRFEPNRTITNKIKMIAAGESNRARTLSPFK
jgi:hypothetical protein